MPVLYPEGQGAVEFFTLPTLGTPQLHKGVIGTATREGCPELSVARLGCGQKVASNPSIHLPHDLFHYILSALLGMGQFKDPVGQ